MKKITDYLHLYIGCECDLTKADNFHFPHTVKLDYGLAGNAVLFPDDYKVKPILRLLSDMTDSEAKECGNLDYDFSDDPEMSNFEYTSFEVLNSANQFAWLLSKHFDLFGLIEFGLAIDASTLTNPTP